MEDFGETPTTFAVNARVEALYSKWYDTQSYWISAKSLARSLFDSPKFCFKGDHHKNRAVRLMLLVDMPLPT